VSCTRSRAANRKEARAQGMTHDRRDRIVVGRRAGFRAPVKRSENITANTQFAYAA
jgi:hypothetical protein